MSDGGKGTLNYYISKIPGSSAGILFEKTTHFLKQTYFLAEIVAQYMYFTFNVIFPVPFVGFRDLKLLIFIQTMQRMTNNAENAMQRI